MRSRRAPSGLDQTALTDDDFAALVGNRFGTFGSLVLAVSGGADSTALMHLTARWWQRTDSTARPAVMVATVDHGLRPESRAEADWVSTQAARLGLAHRTLCWRQPNATTGLQAAAREARYQLLRRLAEAQPAQPCAIVLAHQLDDVAETLLMRLARGSGIDGLASIAPERGLAPDEFGAPDLAATAAGVQILRPLLSIPRTRLQATLRQLAAAWLDDPSNDCAAFERVRLRQAQATLNSVGLSNAKLALSAQRLARAREAVDWAAQTLVSNTVCLHDGAYAAIAFQAWSAAPRELRIKTLSRIIARFGGTARPPRLSQLEALEQRLLAGSTEVRDRAMAATLCGCHLELAQGELRVFREHGRTGLPEVRIAPGQTALWDRRFLVHTEATHAAPVIVRALPALTLRRWLADHGGPLPLPQRAALTLPSFWDGERLLAVPHRALRQMRPPGSNSAGRFTATFLGLSPATLQRDPICDD